MTEEKLLCDVCYQEITDDTGYTLLDVEQERIYVCSDKCLIEYLKRECDLLSINDFKEEEKREDERKKDEVRKALQCIESFQWQQHWKTFESWKYIHYNECKKLIQWAINNEKLFYDSIKGFQELKRATYCTDSEIVKKAQAIMVNIYQDVYNRENDANRGN